MRNAVDPAQSCYDAGSQCWEVPTDAVHRGHAPARTADHQDPWQVRCNGVRRRHSLGSRGTAQVRRDRGDVQFIGGRSSRVRSTPLWSRLGVQLSRRERPPPHRRRRSSHRSTRPMRGTSTARRASMRAKGRHVLGSASRQPRRLRSLGSQFRRAAHSVRRSSRASVLRRGGGSALLCASVEGKFASLEGKFASLEGKFASLEGKFASLEGKFEL